MYLGFWRLDARKPPPLLEVSEKYAPEVSKSGQAAVAPKEARKTSDAAEINKIRCNSGAKAVTASGRSAPAAKLAADANAA